MKGRLERGKTGAQAESSRTLSLEDLGEDVSPGDRMIRDVNTHPGEDWGQSQEGGTIQQGQCKKKKKMDLFKEFFSFI